MSLNAAKVSERIEQGSQDMDKLIKAMSEIQESSAGIGKIIKIGRASCRERV